MQLLLLRAETYVYNNNRFRSSLKLNNVRLFTHRLSKTTQGNNMIRNRKLKNSLSVLLYDAAYMRQWDKSRLLMYWSILIFLASHYHQFVNDCRAILQQSANLFTYIKGPINENGNITSKNIITMSDHISTNKIFKYNFPSLHIEFCYMK